MTGQLIAGALITGASSGIGRAIAESLARRGFALCLAGRDSARLEETRGLVKGARVLPLAGDLKDDEYLARLVGCVEQSIGRLDVLVHSAASSDLSEFATMDPDTWDLEHRVNVRAPAQLTRLCLPLLERARGDIVFINSTAGLSARPGAAHYSMTKHALRSLADSLRLELNEKGIRVLSVFPGRTATPMQRGLHAARGLKYQPEHLMRPSDVAAMVAQAVSLPRPAEVTEIVMRPITKPAAPERTP